MHRRLTHLAALASLVSALLLSSCRHLDPLSRPEATTPACLAVSGSAEQVAAVEDAATAWNSTLARTSTRSVFGLARHDPGDPLACAGPALVIPVGFVADLARHCAPDPRSRGCMITESLVRRNEAGEEVSREAYWREVLVDRDLRGRELREVVMHELGHVVGCRHSDYRAPCVW